MIVMSALLVVATGFSFLLHLFESHRLRSELEAVVENVVRRVAEEVVPGGRLAPEVHRERSFRGVSINTAVDFRTGIIMVQRIDGWIDGGVDSGLADEEPDYGFQDRVIPPARIESVLVDDLRDPLEAVRKESLPRELLIAGSVFLVGLAMVWLLAGRLTGPITDLTRKMERVRKGDLKVRVRPTTEDEVGQMASTFNSMVESLRDKRELEQKIFQTERLSAMGTLAAGVAHDIRNPLNTVGLTLAHLGERYAPSDPRERERFCRYMDDVRTELGRLNQRVRDFLSMAHPDRGEIVQCELDDLVTECLRLFRKEAESMGVTVEANLDSVEPVRLNPQQFRGALTNVVLNALRAMEASGGELKVSLFSRWGENGRVPGSEIVLRIADNGCGIAPADLDKIFLPYFTTREDGTGLGLPIARSVVEASGGRLEVESRAGEGTQVDIIFDVQTTAERGAIVDMEGPDEGRDHEGTGRRHEITGKAR